MDRNTMEQWVQRNFELRRRYYSLIAAGIEQKLARPASEAEISVFESHIGYPLPPSYRMLLSLHNGWRHWEGDTHLLSLEQMRHGPYADWVRAWKEEAKGRGETLIRQGLVVATALHADTGLILDTALRHKGGEMTIVNWEHQEIARYWDFLELLQRDAEDWEALVEGEESGRGEP
ncbi:MAG: SMI1/KNR4 family protein [Tepidiformaceae bacterium]